MKKALASLLSAALLMGSVAAFAAPQTQPAQSNQPAAKSETKKSGKKHHKHRKHRKAKKAM